MYQKVTLSREPAPAPLINPRSELAIVPRKVTWESGIQNSAKSGLGPGKDSEQSTVTGSSKRYKTAITVIKIIGLIKTPELIHVQHFFFSVPVHPDSL